MEESTQLRDLHSFIANSHYPSHDDVTEPHVIEDWERVRVNVSGTVFETYRKTLQQREGSIFNLDNIRNYYDTENCYYYFDRNPKAFESIFTFMQCGILCTPVNAPFNVFIEDLQFFGFGDKAFKLFQEDSRSGKITKKVTKSYQNPFLNSLWRLLEVPDSGFWAKAMASWSIFNIVLAICLFSIDTLPEVRAHPAGDVIKKIEYICVSWFTLEITLRFVASPTKTRFFLNFMNIIDLVSLIPYYMDIFWMERGKSYSKLVMTSMRTLRIARLFNLLKLYRYSRAIRVMAKTLYSSIAELSMLLFFVAIGTMLFSPLLYYFEFEDSKPSSDFESIPHVFWFCIVTTTTVGFGELVPQTAGGKLATGVLSICSVLLITLPIPIIGRNFLIFYEESFGETKPDALKSFDTTKSKQVENEPLLLERETDL